MNFAAAKKNFGSFEFGGVEYALVNMAQADNHGTDGAVRYYASAINEAGEAFRVALETLPEWNAASAVAQADFRGQEADLDAIAQEHGVEIDEFENIDLNDETNACDWDSPVEVTAA